VSSYVGSVRDPKTADRPQNLGYLC